MKKIIFIGCLILWLTPEQIFSSGFTFNASTVTTTDSLSVGALILSDGSVTAIGNAGRIFVGTTSAIGGSNAGIQYSHATANRGQIRMNQFGNNTGVAGLTGFKSRGATVADFAAVAAGDSLVRLTGIGIPANNLNLFLSGTYSLVVATSGPLTAQVPSYWEWNSTNFAGVSGIVMNTTPEGALVIKAGVTASSATFGAVRVSSSIFFSDGSEIDSINKVVAVSSSTIVSGLSIPSATAAYTCVKSTLTITTAYSRSYFVAFDGTMVASGGADVYLAPIIDGQAPNLGGLNNYKTYTTSAGQEFAPSFMFTTPSMPAGTHTFCVAIWTAAGTVSTPANYPCQFSVIGH